jgi:uncharacterized protein
MEALSDCHGATMKDALLQSDRAAQRAGCLVWWYIATPPLLFVVLNTILFFLCFVLYFGTAVRVVYGFNTLVMPCVFLLSSGLLFQAYRIKGAGPWTRRVAIAWTVAALVLFGIRIYATHIEPKNLQVRNITLSSTKLTVPITVLHISDIQSAGIGRYEVAVFKMIRELSPDLILHTGDLLQPIPPKSFESELPKIAHLIGTLRSPSSFFLVQGDSDGPLIHTSPEELGGAAYLLNQSIASARGTDRIRVYGLMLADSANGAPILPTITDWIAEDPDALNIVLGHRPDFILNLSDIPIDLCLAGHTHGGQIRVPFYGPLLIGSNIPRNWAWGARKVGNTWLNVSAGVGAEHARGLPSIRLNCPPEMTLIRISPAK